MYMHAYTGGGSVLCFGLSMIMYSMYVWWRDIVREGTFEGQHTNMVQLGLRMGMILFIVSEVMFFFAFFWREAPQKMHETETGLWCARTQFFLKLFLFLGAKRPKQNA